MHSKKYLFKHYIIPCIKITIFLICLIYLFYLEKPLKISIEGWHSLIIFFIIAYLWATQLIDLYTTSILAIALIVLFNVADIKGALSGFSSNAIFIILIGFGLATSLVITKLDQRLAITILKYFKSEKGILFGIIMITGLLSTILSNTTTTIMMFPIIKNILKNIRSKKKHLYYIAIAFSANIGGVGFLIGTPPNLIAAEYLKLNFYEWTLYGFPFMLLMLLTLYFIFSFYVDSKIIKVKLKNLGKISFKEIQSAFLILLALTLWMTSHLHKIDTITIGFIILTLLLIFVIKWRDFEKETEWGVLIMLGSAISLSNALINTGASSYIANLLMNIIDHYPPILIITFCILFALFLTQFIQNTVTTALLVPILLPFAKKLNISELALILPITFAVSMTFLMPPSTAPNLIIYSKGRLKVWEYFKYGITPTLFAIFYLIIFSYLLLYIL